MSLTSAFAVYFIIWWLTLVVVLPIGVRTQEEEGDITLGTTESAPAHFNFWRKALVTTIVSAGILGFYYVLSVHFGFGLDSLPEIVPKFD